ncbi:MAG: cytochrome ubiquinol oxidase subunit I [Pseudomonadota bacterium]|uniref:cytochrome ubiquinol oxidase subunit I n=1 Tax=Thermithiobacillus tepidarius TaxID=929 RepID=UPI0003F67B7D|nr:cytochrome ubiquinol oxidase subunit I [Thermithiobacillus tepidarius]
MEDWLSVYMLSRIQFGVIAAFHILFPPLTMGLSLILLTFEVLWLRTRDAFYYRQLRFWTKLFLLNFGVGVVSGIPLEFSFGTNWAPFARDTGSFVGHLLGYEAVLAFMLESAFLSIMVFGWRRVSAGVHLFATAMVALGANLSAFWIMSANSWMQTPSGAVFQDGKAIITDYFAAIFNEDLPAAYWHMTAAALELSLFVLGGVSAWYLLRGRHADFFLRLFKGAALALLLVAPLQIWLGDLQGQSVARSQPAKLAAMEAHWQTNPPGTGAAWALLAWPDEAGQRNLWSLDIPYGLSLLVTHSPHGQVRGLREFPPADQPPVWIPFYSFRIMVAAGFFMAAVALWTLWAWRRGDLTPARIGTRRWLLRAWMACIPIAYLAIETGWFTREVGRQPWIVYGIMRTEHAYSALPLGTLLWSLVTYIVVYGVIITMGFILARRILRAGPDLSSPPPAPTGTAPDQRPLPQGEAG